ncbi:VWFA-related Acidobacterial domain [Bordetella ansorpii]|uniref:VWFA-related Acidobacterial domain n=1 Tax=Bordetella ansorpii TaxID=288768 RepID=A0A157M7S1_9BORD|nr:VWA domain-containing protein [Bordetella ansorpii]SAI04714.1 VWFA-related Acidobacterial domain [Bordetella ansorpii]
MQFLWPDMLWLLLVLPALAAAYVYVLTRRKKAAVIYASLALPRAAMGPGQRLRRHIPPVLFLLALGAALLACARPSATVTLPSDAYTLVLAMDVSRSMDASDIPPTRMVAAQEAARAFVAQLPSSARVGIVSFAAAATLVQAPTEFKQDMLDAIDRFELQRGTATGSGLLMALATLFPDDGIDASAMRFESVSPQWNGKPMPLGQAQAARERQAQREPVPPGSYTNGAIILLSDGRRTTGPDPMEAARLAADRGVRVYTVGFGTPKGSAVMDDGWSFFMQLDETTLRAVAKLTGGEYFQAGSAADLGQVYKQLTTRLALEKRETEIGALLAGLAALLMVLACTLSILWFRR